jgi:hypothetical protein
MLTKEEKMKMLGVSTQEAAYKLNEVSINGDDGKFRLRDILGEKQDDKYQIHELGNKISGVVLKMRWRFARYEEVQGQENGIYHTSTEFDNKHSDTVTVYPSKEKGLAVDMKEKYDLSTQRVVYFYLPERKEVVRLIIKSSALTGDKNPKQEMGLFEYQDFLRKDDVMLCDTVTDCSGVWREDAKNKRKSYWTMQFEKGRDLSDSEKDSIEAKMRELDSKLHKPVKEDAKAESADEALSRVLDEADGASVDESDGIPF